MGITFDVACFLNIGQDHISDVEHTDFDDYLIPSSRYSHSAKRP